MKSVDSNKLTLGLPCPGTGKSGGGVKRTSRLLWPQWGLSLLLLMLPVAAFRQAAVYMLSFDNWHNRPRGNDILRNGGVLHSLFFIWECRLAIVLLTILSECLRLANSATNRCSLFGHTYRPQLYDLYCSISLQIRDHQIMYSTPQWYVANFTRNTSVWNCSCQTKLEMHSLSF